jgi:hypothetical protein
LQDQQVERPLQDLALERMCASFCHIFRYFTPQDDLVEWNYRHYVSLRRSEDRRASQSKVSLPS